MNDRAQPKRSDLITVTNGRESPSAGRWTIPSVSVSIEVGSRRVRRRRTMELAGSLVVAQDSLAKTLVLRSSAAGLDGSASFRFRGRLIDEDRFGGWRFDGAATYAGLTYALEVRVDYRGVFANGELPVCWLSLVCALVAPRSVGRRQRVVRSLSGELSALGITQSFGPPAPFARAS